MYKLNSQNWIDTYHYVFDAERDTVTIKHDNVEFSYNVADLTPARFIPVPMNENERLFKSAEDFKAGKRAVNALYNIERITKAYKNASAQYLRTVETIRENKTPEKVAAAIERRRELAERIATILYSVTDAPHAAEYADNVEWSEYDNFVLHCFANFTGLFPAAESDCENIYRAFGLFIDDAPEDKTAAKPHKVSSMTEKRTALYSFIAAAVAKCSALDKIAAPTIHANKTDVEVFEKYRVNGFKVDRKGNSGKVNIVVRTRADYATMIPTWFSYYLQYSEKVTFTKEDLEILDTLHITPGTTFNPVTPAAPVKADTKKPPKKSAPKKKPEIVVE